MIQTNDNQIRALVNEVLANELSAVLPLLDRLRELADPRWGRLYSALGKLAIDTAAMDLERRNREQTGQSPGYQAYQIDRDRRRVWNRFHRAVRQLFWEELAEVALTDIPGTVAHVLDLPALLERPPALPPYMNGGSTDSESEGTGEADPAHDLIW